MKRKERRKKTDEQQQPKHTITIVRFNNNRPKVKWERPKSEETQL